MLDVHSGSTQKRGTAMIERVAGEKLRLLLLDDYVLAREAMRAILTEAAFAHVVEGATPEEAIALFRRSRPDVVLLSFTLGNSSGLRLVKSFLDVRPSAKVLVLSVRARATYANCSLAAGATGYISKSASAEELVKAVSMVARGEHYLEPEIATKIALRRLQGVTDVCDKLTLREREILRLIGEGKDLSAIASTFGIAYKTVANACTRLKDKLGACSTSDLVRVAYELHND